METLNAIRPPLRLSSIRNSRALLCPVVWVELSTSKNAEPPLRSQSATLNADQNPLGSQTVTLKRGQHRKYLPRAFALPADLPFAEMLVIAEAA